MSYDGDTLLADCGAVHPLTKDVCTMPAHDDKGQHAGNGRTWRNARPERRRQFRGITSADPAVVEAFAFGLFSTGAKLNNVSMERAVTLWQGAPAEDRAVWLDRARGVVDAALSYVPA